MTVSTCPSSRLSVITFTREKTLPATSIKDYRRQKEHEERSRSTDNMDHARKIKTAPAARTIPTKTRCTFQRQPSKPDIRPFSEGRKSQSVPTSPGPRVEDAPRKTKRVQRDRLHSDYFRDRSYMSDVYSWARASQEKKGDQIKGMDLTETILSYKPERPRKNAYLISDNEDPLRSGLGYEGYMDCLLRGRKHRLNRKQWGITSELTIKNEHPTLVPVNSVVKE